MANNKRVQNFVKRMQWVAGIPHAWSKADELSVLIGDAKQNPVIARAACQQYSGSVANSILRALDEMESDKN